MTNPRIPQKGPFVKPMNPGTYWWCACGHSQDQPFCDGSHKGTGMTPRKVEITADGMVAWCGCKHSGSVPYCDGSHNHLS